MDNNYSPADLDAWARTVATEANPNDPDGQLAVAHVVANRLAAGGYGDTPRAVVLSPNQFEVWQNGRAQAVDPRSPQYKSAMDAINGVLSGQADDPTGGATHFYSPSGQVALGRNAPSWAKGKPNANIGGQLFYAPNGAVNRMADALPYEARNILDDFDLDSAKVASQPATPAPTSQPAKVSKKAANGKTSLGFAPDDYVPPDQRAATAAAQPAPVNILDHFDLAPADATPPAPAQPATAPGRPSPIANASATGFATGVPIVGPAFNEGLDRVLAGVNALATGRPYSDSLNALKARENEDVAAHPTAYKAGEVGGAVGGVVPLMAVAPGAFGLGAGGLGINALAATGTGGALGGVDALARNGLDPGAIERGAAVGALGGGLGPVIGAGAGKVVNALANVATRTTPVARNFTNALSEVGMTPSDASNALSRFGPEGTLADIDPALTDLAGGLAARGGKPTSILKTAMDRRAAGADSRVANSVDAYLGPKPDLTATQNAIDTAAHTAASPFYKQASTAPMDIMPVLSDINNSLRNAVGGEARVLREARSYLTEEASVPGGGTMLMLKSDPQALLKARQGLDDYISKLPIAETTAGKHAESALINVRQQLDSALKSDPAIAQGDAIYAQHMRVKDALNQGTDLFSRKVRVEDFRRELASMTPAEVEAMRQGARVAIGDALEKARRGQLSEAKSMFGKSTANRAKLEALFPRASDVFDMIHGEAAMRATESTVAHNSATASRNAILEPFKPKEANALAAGPAILGEAFGGGPGALAMSLGNALLKHMGRSMSENALNRLAEGTARGLSATGPEQAIFLNQLYNAARTNRAVNALASGASVGSNLLTRGGGNALNLYLDDQFAPVR